MVFNEKEIKVVKLTWEKAEEIRELVKRGVGRVEIADTYKISVETVNKIWTKRLWLHPPKSALSFEEYIALRSEE